MNKFLLISSFLTILFLPNVAIAQNYDLEALPQKKYQSYPSDIPDKKWVSLFFRASRQYEREDAKSWSDRYYSNDIILKSDGTVLGWVKDETDEETHWLVRTSIRNCQGNNYSANTLFTEYWQGGNLLRRTTRNPYYYYANIESLGLESICEIALAEHRKRI
ncbi:MAG: hypothetical protein HC799_13700 [Limnothrix sp. RL_2_0]|nr:hypothetical protein [Limnothrix sp. RL_2_0]